MQIIFENENTQLQEYRFNFEELKNELNLSLDKYRNLIVTDEAIKEAKASRADLNKLKKELSDKVIEIKKKHLQPFDLFKSQTDQLISLINEPVQAIDTQIKAYEQKLRDDKYKQIEKFWAEQCPISIDIPFNKVFKESYLNVNVSMKKITEEIEVFFQKAISDVEIIKSFSSEFEIGLLEEYTRNFDMSSTMALKAKLEERKAAQIERERQDKERIDKLEAEKQARLLKEEHERADKTKMPCCEIDCTKEATHRVNPDTHRETLTCDQHIEDLKEDGLPSDFTPITPEIKESTTFILTINKVQKELIIQFFKDNSIEYLTV